MFFADDGHFYSLVASERRPDMGAGIYTSFRNTTGECLRLFYMYLGQSPSTLLVKVKTENGTTRVIKEVMWRKVL